jgi:Fe-Mn family superoxide dismutase
MHNLESTRRSLIRGAAALSAVAVAGIPVSASAAKPFKLSHTPVAQIPLPFAEDALAPVISARTVALHYGKHHKIYADKVAAAIKGTPLAEASLEQVVVASSKDPAKASLFNMSGQVWNHNFYWQSLSPSQQTPSGKVKAAIERDFGSVEACVKSMTEVCVGQFGSGWGWLVSDGKKLKAMSTSNADTPFLHKLTPLLTVDVWEHAYYLDYENRRPEHVAAVLDKILNWEFAERNFEAV